MRTAIHLALILIVGIGLGLTLRRLKSSGPAAGPPPGETVYSNDDVRPGDELDPGSIEKDEVTKPPHGAEWLSRFELTERSGETVTSEQLLGQPYLVSFFFTTCPSSCVQQNQKLKQLQDEFEGDRVRFVAISCDPETDTPEALREYAARFGADQDQWLFLTGDLTYIRRVGAEVYSLPVNQKFHTDRFVLVDSEGKIEGYYSWPEPRQFDQLREKIRSMLSETKDS